MDGFDRSRSRGAVVVGWKQEQRWREDVGFPYLEVGSVGSFGDAGGWRGGRVRCEQLERDGVGWGVGSRCEWSGGVVGAGERFGC